MPTREQIDAVVREIDIWLGGLNVLRIEDKPGIPAPEGPRFLFWAEMNQGYRELALASEIDWEGFTEGQKDNVIRRVIDGQGVEFWMDGIVPDEQSERRSPGLREAAPSREELRRVTREIEAMFEEYSFRAVDDRHVALASHGRGTDDGHRFWGELTDAQKRDALAQGVDWQGFSEGAKADVIGRIIDCEVGRLDPAHQKLFRLPESPPSHIDNRKEDAITMGDSQESPLASVERQVQEVKRATINGRDEIVGPWSELDDAARLEELEGGVNWSVISDRQKESLLAREVDFSKITRDQLNHAYESLGSYDIGIDERPARRMFDEASFAKAVAEAGRTSFAEQLTQARDTTRNLVEAIRADEWPRNAAVVDFGLDSQEHYEALYYPIRNGELMPAVLDAAMGHGEKLTELARTAPSNPHKDIQFHTSWDTLLGREQTSEPGSRTSWSSLRASRSPEAEPQSTQQQDYGQDHEPDDGVSM